MCRWLAYTGSPVLLTDVLYTPVHSLIDQSLHSKLARAETTNGDGFGVGWNDATSALESSAASSRCGMGWMPHRNGQSGRHQ
jgi:predicted glutamine amidotransferase